MAYKIVYIHSRRAMTFPYKYSDSYNATDGKGLVDGEFVIPADARMDGIEDVCMEGVNNKMTETTIWDGII